MEVKLNCLSAQSKRVVFDFILFLALESFRKSSSLEPLGALELVALREPCQVTRVSACAFLPLIE